MKKLLALLLSVVMAITMFGGCSKEVSDEDDKSEKKQTVSIKGNKEDNEDKEDNENKENNHKKEIVVGYTIYAPMNYKDDAGNLVGFDTELAEAVFQGLGYKVSFKEIDWSKKYDILNDGTVDCVWNGFEANYTDDDGIARSEKVDFSYKYMENKQIVIVKKDAAVEKLTDLNNKKAVAEKGSAGEEFARGVEGATVKIATRQTDCLMEVMSGTADFAVVDALWTASYVGKGDYADLKIVDALSSEAEYYAVAFKKGSDLTAKVNEQLEKLAKDGTIAKLAEKYNVSATAITDFSDQKK